MNLPDYERQRIQAGVVDYRLSRLQQIIRVLKNAIGAIAK